MTQIPNCPNCQSEYAYEDRGLFVCPECGNEWQEQQAAEEAPVYKDTNGNILVNETKIRICKKRLKTKSSSHLHNFFTTLMVK